MAVKKTTKKNDFEKKVEEVKKTTTQTAKKVEEEWKKIATWIGAWWSKATEEERIYMILWVILLVLWLYVLRGIVWGLLLIILWILFVTWFFANKKSK
jgi:Flp pilus assembly protein TadB